MSTAHDGSPWPMCGRDDELRFIADVLAGSETRGVVLAGPPGVGKTRLAAEALQHCRHRGSVTAWVAATATTAEIPLGPFAPLLPVECASAADRFSMLALGCRSLAATAGGAELVLAVDDAHLLDPISAELVHQAVAGSSVRLLATLRRDAPTPDALIALCNSGLAARLEVESLSKTEMAGLVTRVLGGQILGSVLQQLWEVTRGNALFVREIVQEALRTGDLERHEGVWRLRGALIPGAGLLTLVEQRLGRLSASEHRAVERVALAEPIDIEVLQRITPIADVESLEGHGLVTVTVESGRLQARLVHPLYAEAIRVRTPVLRARRIFGELAETAKPIETLCGVDLLRVAAWRLDSGGECSSELLVKACAQARSLLDFTLAERLARGAVDRNGGLAARRALGDCLYAQGRFTEADEHLEPLTEQATTETARAQTAMSYATNLMWGLGRDVEADQVLIAALRATSSVSLVDEISTLRARLALAGGRLHDSIEATSALLDQPQVATASATLSAAAGLAPALALSGRTTEALAVVEEHLSLAFKHRYDEPRVLGMLIVSGCTARWLAGDLPGTTIAAEQLYDLAVAAHSSEGICAAARIRGWAALAAGLPHTAMRWLHEALAAVPAGDINGLACWCLALLTEAAAIAGDPRAATLLAQAEAARRPAIHIYDSQLSLARAWVTAREGNLPAAVSIVTDAARDAAELGAHGTEVHLLHAAVRFGHPETVARRLGEVAEMVDGRWAPVFAAHALAHQARDGSSLEAVASAFEDIGALLLAAEASAGAANAFRAGGLPSKSRVVAARAATLAAQCQPVSTPALVGIDAPAPLTRREREIGALAARGMSSPEIARCLVVSVRTVEGHLYRLFTKLGVSHRDELARRLGA
jgi:DNA-binding CsgD family transcriptional regulator/tetratricopeptide (TPR) repeat protein